ncbi:hypothetical protein PNH38_06645 [Anoxybacillus rupiensis]|uniref:Uncharacterized protein n=1 Tax=Anoxybacteroides rupiense TaxID=311460 RepID=A0ABT5W2L4_9BACL|nr:MULTISPECIES: hypothetical protein [Anoxybacillus]MBS2770919.1 hypothetical protein [Anoxybacillus rupiensis]MDE8563568.1 hypothetical protein [Anoxybacillus rupiensis]QHC04358.1 hypothetical protein GRQ40_10565 [Anoxybacillus sp. PDR2]
MVVHELISTEAIFTEELKKGYHVLLQKYKKVDIKVSDIGFIQEMKDGSEEVVEVVFDPGNEYSLVRLGSYTFENGAPSLAKVQQTLLKHHRDIFEGAVSA